MFRWLMPWKDEPNYPTRMEWAKHMDALGLQISKLSIKITEYRKKFPTLKANEIRELERQWEELICLHMEFEWGLHPQNPEPAHFKE